MNRDNSATEKVARASRSASNIGRPRKYPTDQSTRELLLKTAQAIFADKGFSAASIAEICKVAKVANGTFYVYFSTKQEVFLELLRRIIGQLEQMLTERSRRNLSPIQNDLNELSIMVDFADQNREMFRMIVRERILASSGRSEIFEVLAQRRVNDMQAGVSKGYYRSDINAEITARAEVGMMVEVLRWWISDSAPVSREMLIDELWHIRQRLMFE